MRKREKYIKAGISEENTFNGSVISVNLKKIF